MDKKQVYLANEREEQVLDSYFSMRYNNDDKVLTLVAERKTTIQIQDDLHPILDIKDEVIVDYLLRKGYMLVHDDDGSPIWQMYRLR